MLDRYARQQLLKDAVINKYKVERWWINRFGYGLVEGFLKSSSITDNSMTIDKNEKI